MMVMVMVAAVMDVVELSHYVSACLLPCRRWIEQAEEGSMTVGQSVMERYTTLRLKIKGINGS